MPIDPETLKKLRSYPDRKQTVKERHRLVAVLLAADMDADDVAKAVGCSPWTVRSLQKREPFKVMYNQEREKFLDRVRDYAARRFDMETAVLDASEEVFNRKLELIRQTENLPVAERAADSFMRRIMPEKKGRGPREAPGNTTVNVIVTPEQKALAIKTLKEDGVTVDVTPRKRLA